MIERVAILGGIRTPFIRAGGPFEALPPDEMGRLCVVESLNRLPVAIDRVGLIVVGTVVQPAGAVNLGRVIALRAGLSEHVPASTVNCSGASGLAALICTARSVVLGEADLAVAAGTESMSSIPLLFSREIKTLAEETSLWKQARSLSSSVPRLRPRRLLSRAVLARSFTDPTCALTMGETAEVLAREFGISREVQDEYALLSHKRAHEARRAGRLAEEILPLLAPPAYDAPISEDDGIRPDTTLEELATLKPAFDRRYGTVTRGNSAGIADGAAALVLMTESGAQKAGVTPLGFIRDYTMGGLPAHRMGLGSAYALSSLLARSGRKMEEVGLVELHEAFAAQVLANERVFEDDRWSEWVTGHKAVGHIDRSILNVNGGAIALGHPTGSSGIRLVLTLLLEMRRRGVELGVAATCAGGGLGAAVLVEAS